MQIGIVLAILSIDQLSKLLLFDVAILNRGIGFGISQSSGWLSLIFVVFGVLATFLLYLATPVSKFPVSRWVWPLILGASVSNLIDRARFGGVIDPFKLPVTGIHFNIADVAIVVGFIVLLVTTSGVRKRKQL